jgi:4-hydroxy-3-polyprenylbenzoate decarboxylase
MTTPSDTAAARREGAPPPRLIVGITGASGVIYGVRLLQQLQGTAVQTHLVMSRPAEITLAYETDLKVADVHALADVVHGHGDMAAAISSGSFRTLGMVVAPCSARSLAEIAGGQTASLLTRAADVVLKERRRLVLMLRETPLHHGHLRNMLQASEMGAILAPPVPAFYANPQSLEELVDQSVGRVLDLFDIDAGAARRWGEPVADGRPPLRAVKTAGARKG